MSHNTSFFDTVLSPTPPTQSQFPHPSHAPPTGISGSTTTTHGLTSTTSPRSFTPAQQSLQARNKSFTSPTSPAAEHYEARQKRYEAIEILENVELLMWFSMMRNESLPATRAHYTNLSLGLAPPKNSILYREEWEVPLAERVPTPQPSSSSRTPRKGTKSHPNTPKSGSRAKAARPRMSGSPALFNDGESD